MYDPNLAIIDATPKLVVMLSEVWTMADPRDLRGLVSLGVDAERAGADGVLIGEHVVMGPTASRDGLPATHATGMAAGTRIPPRRIRPTWSCSARSPR
jgi:alkanesulfonate monooxygenase SsuD/methylene tetrahydromethanopterin reductase-like flavin-dependent oxidoreductase (luciferase family)